MLHVHHACDRYTMLTTGWPSAVCGNIYNYLLLLSRVLTKKIDWCWLTSVTEILIKMFLCGKIFWAKCWIFLPKLSVVYLYNSVYGSNLFFKFRIGYILHSMKIVDISMDLHNHKGSAVRKLALAQIRLIISLVFVINCVDYTFEYSSANMSLNPVVISSSVKQSATVSIIELYIFWI